MSKSNRRVLGVASAGSAGGGSCVLSKTYVLIIALTFFAFMMVVNTFLFPSIIANREYKSSFPVLRGTDKGILGGNYINNENNNNNNNKIDLSSEENPSRFDVIHTMMNTESDEGSINMSEQEKELSSSSPVKKIAYAITVTKDGPFVDGALVLGYSAYQAHNNTLRRLEGLPLSPYSAELVAFVVPSVVSTRAILSRFGWKIIEKTIPVALDEIENKNYMAEMRDSGCCGADEFLKLWAFTLTEYHRVVHLDMDSIIYQNMDDLYTRDKDLLYTGDYGMKGGSPVAPAQGGFLVIKPSLEIFEEFRSIIRKGDYGHKGWGGSGIGNFWGGQTIQGILPYYFHVVQKTRGEEVNRCIYNCMVDNPYFPYKSDSDKKICLNGQETCEDCRLQVPEKVKSAHFTICQKPWTCTRHDNPRNMVLCKALHEKWFSLRDGFETHHGMDLSYRNKGPAFPNYLGICKGDGERSYLPIPI